MLTPPKYPNFPHPSYTPKNNDLEYLEYWEQFKEYHYRMYVYSLQQVEYFQAKLDQAAQIMSENRESDCVREADEHDSNCPNQGEWPEAWCSCEDQEAVADELD